MDMSIFESIRRIDENGVEYWTSRELASALDYQDYRNFQNVIAKAREAIANSGEIIHNHIVDVTEMVSIGSGAQRERDNLKLDRYACYLIMQNADPSKVVVALGQTYFAIQTRKQELAENLIEDNKRIRLREEITKHNTSLASSAKQAGVSNFGVFQNDGYRGLYGGMSVQNIHAKKKLKKSQKILDHMGSEELAANLFRATQADAKLKRESIKGEMNARVAHYQVGQQVRKAISDIGGTMPENLPTPDGIGQAKKRLKNDNKAMKSGDEK